MPNPFTPNAEVLRVLKFHSDLFALVFTGQNQIIARLDVVTKFQMETLKRLGMAESEIADMLKEVFSATLAKLEKGVRESVAEIERNLPAVEGSDESNNNN